MVSAVLNLKKKIKRERERKHIGGWVDIKLSEQDKPH